MKSLKQWLPEVLVVIIFVGISFAYFFPADIEGRILYRHDSSANRGAGQEAHEYNEEVSNYIDRAFQICYNNSVLLFAVHRDNKNKSQGDWVRLTTDWDYEQKQRFI